MEDAAFIIFYLRLNPVGYSSKAAEANLNFYAPQFTSIGCNTTDISDINLNDGGSGMCGYGDSMQVVGPLGNPKEMYTYWYGWMDPVEGRTKTDYYWSDGEMNPVSVSFDRADGVAIDNAAELTFTIVGAGEVPSGDVTFAAQPNLNWAGNPFSAPISINDIQLDDGGTGVCGYGDSMQIVGPLGNPKEMYTYWYGWMDPVEGRTTTDYYWSDGEMNPVNITLQPGDGFAIDNAAELEFSIVIKCPYSL